ncbi:MAG: hypothetical protein WCH39_28875 [Schlesneria sp.]
MLLVALANLFLEAGGMMSVYEFSRLLVSLGGHRSPEFNICHYSSRLVGCLV